jgi:hypothetical protein
MVSIKAQFILNMQGYENGDGHTECKAKNVYKRIKFLSHEIAHGDFEIVLEHDQPPKDRVRNKEGKHFEHLTPIP